MRTGSLELGSWEARGVDMVTLGCARNGRESSYTSPWAKGGLHPQVLPSFQLMCCLERGFLMILNDFLFFPGGLSLEFDVSFDGPSASLYILLAAVWHA